MNDRSWTRSYFWRTWTERTKFLLDELCCEHVHSGVCERRSFAVQFRSRVCQIFCRKPAKTHRKHGFICSGKKHSSGNPRHQSRIAACVIILSKAWRQKQMMAALPQSMGSKKDHSSSKIVLVFLRINCRGKSCSWQVVDWMAVTKC